MSDLKVSAKEVIKWNTEELNKKKVLFKKELFSLRFQKTLGELKNTSRFSFVRKVIARINTELAIRSKIGE